MRAGETTQLNEDWIKFSNTGSQPSPYWDLAAYRLTYLKLINFLHIGQSNQRPSRGVFQASCTSSLKSTPKRKTVGGVQSTPSKVLWEERILLPIVTFIAGNSCIGSLQMAAIQLRNASLTSQTIFHPEELAAHSWVRTEQETLAIFQFWRNQIFMRARS